MSTDTRPVLLVLASTYPRWLDDSEPGFVHELARRLADTFRVLVLAPHASGARVRETLQGVEVIRYRYAPAGLETLVNDGGIVANLHRHRWKFLLLAPFVFSQLWWAYRLLRRERIDIVHAHWLLPQGLIAACALRLAGSQAPLVVTSHGADLHALRGRFMDALKRHVLRRATAATVVSQSMRAPLAALGPNLRVLRVEPMGVDMHDRFAAIKESPCFGRQLLFVGRLVEKKGLRHLLDAMPHILDRCPDATLAVVGFGPEEPVLRTQASALGIASAVEFIGPVQQAELPALYRSAAVFVAPFVRAASGDEEGLGLVLVEAVSCGCPVVVGRVPAVADVLGESYETLTVDVRDTRQLARRIIAVLERPSQARAASACLRETLAVRFDWTPVSARYRKLLSQVLQENGHGH